MYKIFSHKTFEVSDQIRIHCEAQRTRGGFRHLATLRLSGREPVTAKVCYLNRTWESFEFQRVIKALAYKPGVPAEVQEAILAFAKEGGKAYTEHVEESKSFFRTVGLVAAIGSIMTDNQKDANDWKARMINAGLDNRGFSMPEDWNQLSEDEKSRRLDAVIAELNR